MVLFIDCPEKREQPDGGTVDSKGAELSDHGGIGDNDFQESNFFLGKDMWKENSCGYKPKQNTQIDVYSPFNGLFDNDSQ